LKKTLTILFVLLVGIKFSYSQTFPVQVSTQLIPPYSIHLADYVAPGTDRLAVTILLRDINRVELKVKLRVKIEGQGITLQTKPSYLPPALFIQGGLPERLISTDLVDYFNPDNLDFIGITKRQFLQTGALPEGVYRFTIEVLEYNRGVKISNSGTAVAWLILNDPPIINVPKQYEKVIAQYPQNIVFQWTPRHTGSPNSAFNTEYEFKMVEIWKEGTPSIVEANDAMRTSNTFFESTTQSTSLIYGIAEPALVPGRSYAFQVRAKSIVGIDELDLFKNNGYSQVHSFTFGDTCSPPTEIKLESASSSRIKLSWTGEFQHTAYIVSYREANDPDAEWFENDTYFTDFTINSLKPDTEYEYQIMSECTSYMSEFTELFKAKTLEKKQDEFACGNQVPAFDLNNKELIEKLSPGDYIYAGDFDVKIDSVTGANGIYSGGGKAQLPFLNFVKVRTVFENIKVNTDYRIIDGNVYTYWDPNSRMMSDNTTDEEESEMGEDEVVEEGNSEEVSSSISLDTISLNSPIDTMFTDTDGNLIVTTIQGESITIDANEEVTIIDSNGNSTSISGGAVVSSTNSQSSSTDVSGNSATNSIADADMVFGPLSIKFVSEPQSVQTDSEGYCSFENVEVSFIMSLMGQYEISKEVTIDGALMSFKKHCENNNYKDVEINWQDSEGLDIGAIKFLETRIKKINLLIDHEGKLSGDIDLSALLKQEKQITDIIKVREGISGDFSFSFSNNSSFEGIFDFGGIKDINIDITKNDVVFGSITDAFLNNEGTLNGRIEVASDVISYSSSGIKVDVNELFAEIDLSLENGANLKSGGGELIISEIDGIDGNLTLGIEIVNGIITSEVKSSNLSGYGLTISKLNVRALLNDKFDVTEISGGFDVKHNDFDVAIGINDFEVINGKLIKINGNGRIVYDQLEIEITKISYNSELDKLVIDASVEVETEGMAIAASISEFTIDRSGNIVLGEYQANISGAYQFGPLAVALTAEAERTKNSTWDEYEAEAAFKLKMKSARGKEIEKNIGSALLKFSKRGSREKYRDISLVIEGANIPIGELYSIQAAVKDVDLSIVTDQEYLTGTADDIGNIQIGEGSKVTLLASLDQDKQLGELVRLKKGISGEFSFSFLKGDDFSGDFDFGGIKNMNLFVEKNDKVLASLKGMKIDSELNLAGKIIANEKVSYSTGAFEVTLEKLELDVVVNLNDISTFKVNNGAGKVNISNIKGVEGNVFIDLKYSETGNFNAEVLSDDSNLSAFGMTLEDLNLNADFTSDLELTKIEGSLKAKHNDFDASINISSFKLEQGELKELQANGVVGYKGFEFELEKSKYANSNLSINAKVEIESAGKLAVQNFIINSDGDISVGRIKGNLNKPMITMNFDATFKDNGFKGKFNGDIKLISLGGELDFGAEETYTYGYLRMTAEGKNGIPLGPTGLQLTKVGGQLGYNYYLNFTGGNITGNPKQGNYLLGLTLGISDVGKTFAAEGTTVVQFGNDKLQLSLFGNIKAPRNNPVIESDFNVNYYMPDNSVDGTLSTDISIPASTGMVFKTNSPASINFAMANEEWSVDGGVRASMFKVISFVGNTSLSNSDNSISGYLSGQASYYYHKSFSYDWTLADVNGELELGFNSQISANLDKAGFSGNFGVHVFGNGTLLVSNRLGSIEGSASVDCNAKVSYQNEQGLLAGDAKIVVQSTLVDFEETISIIKTF